MLDSAYRARYLKFRVYTSHKENYIGIGEISILNSFKNGWKINVINSNTTLKKNYQIVTDGPYLNGMQVEMNKGTLKFEFEGTNIALYSTFGKKYGNMKVSVNGSKFQTINLNHEETTYHNLVFFKNNLNKKINKIEIKGSRKDLINIDYFVIDK